MKEPHKILYLDSGSFNVTAFKIRSYIGLYTAPTHVLKVIEIKGLMPIKIMRLEATPVCSILMLFKSNQVEGLPC